MTADLSSLGFKPSAPGAAPAPVASGSDLSSLGFKTSGSAQAPAPATPASGGGGDLLDKASNFVGSIFPAGKVLGQDIGTLAGFGLSKANDLISAGAHALGSPTPATHMAANYDLSAPSPLRAAGAGASLVLTGAAGGVPAGVAGLVPGLEAAAPLGASLSQGAGILPALGRIGVQAGIGAGLGGSNALATGGNVKSGALGGAAISGGLATAGELGSALVESLGANSAASRLTAQKDRLKTLQNAFADSKTDPIQTITQLKTPLKVIDGKVDTSAVEDELEQLQSSINTQSKQLVKAMPGGVTTNEFKSDVEEAIRSNPQIRDSGNVAKALAEVKRRFGDYTESFGDAMNYDQVNGVRVAMNRVYDPETVDVERAIGNVARGYLYDASAEGTGPSGKVLQTLMGQSGSLSDAQNFAQKLRGTAVKGGRLGKYFADTIGAGVGGAVGSALGPFGTAAGAAAGGIAADKALGAYQSSYFNPPTAGPARAVSALTSSPAAKSAAAYGKAGLLGLFAPGSGPGK